MAAEGQNVLLPAYQGPVQPVALAAVPPVGGSERTEPQLSQQGPKLCQRHLQLCHLLGNFEAMRT